MKLEVDLAELGANLVAAPPEATVVAQKAKRAVSLDIPWGERMSLRAVQAEDLAWDMLQLDPEESGLTPKDRLTAFLRYAENHPDNHKPPEVNFNMKGAQVVIDMGKLHLAATAAAECPALLPPDDDVIDVESQ